MKTCRYHQNFGHTTKECVTLKDKIEELIQEGAFVNYIYTPNNNRGSYRARSRGRGGGRRRVININAGGFTSEDSTKLAQQRYLHAIKSMNHISITSSRRSIPPITFTDANFARVDLEQDDPMVITVGIAN
ncbi:hypothetical protein AAZX31_19G147400 [Glycine max]